MTQAPHGGSEPPVELNHVHGRTVGQGAIGLGPDVFRRIELWRVGRELFHVESWMGGDPLVDFFTAMDRAPIPEQDDGSPQMPEQVLQERSDIQAGEIATTQPKVERHPSPLGRHGQGTDRRHPILLRAVAHDRRAAFRGPGARHVGDEQEARFIKEDEVGTTSRGVFLYGASALFSTGRWPRRPVAGLGVRVSDNSIPNWSGASRHDRDGSAPRTACGSSGRHAVGSRDRFDSQRPGALSGAEPPDASSVRERDPADDRAWGATAAPAARVCGTLRPNGTRNSRRPPQPVRSPTEWYPPEQPDRLSASPFQLLGASWRPHASEYRTRASAFPLFMQISIIPCSRV